VTARAKPRNTAPAKVAQRVDGPGIRSLFEAATRALEANRDAINALNVFPVPDGDTGTNMLLTMRSVLEASKNGLPVHAGDAAKTMARAALLGARGNSGLIMAQYFKGFASALGGHPSLEAPEFARGLRAASDNAYAAVPNPREGTMLTVFRECAEKAEAEVARGASLASVWQETSAQARDTVSRTPMMLDVLMQAGVVDSGGYGFAVMLEGALDALTGKGAGAKVIAAPPAQLNGNVQASRVRQEFAAAATEEAWGYCTSFAVQGKGLDLGAIRRKISAMGKSPVIAGDSEAVKVHVHVLDPGKTLSYGTSLGSVSNVDVKNMDEQTREWAQARQAEASPEKATVTVAVVAVVAGNGFEELYRSTGLGVCSLVTGGDSMNPSTAELVAAVERAPSDNVILLPNNKNVIGTAKQVRQITSKQVRVVPTRSMQAGIAALLAFSPEAKLDENATAMEVAAKAVTAVAITRSTRDVTLNGVRVRKGDFIGIVGDDIVTAVADTGEALVRALAGTAPEGSIVTVYYGVGVSAQKAEKVTKLLRDELPGREIELINGGQPHYEYLASVE